MGAGTYIDTLRLTEALTDLGKIKLQNGLVLEEVEVKAKKLEMAYQNGKLTYAPRNTAYQGSMEFLKTVPLLDMDKDENLLLKGDYVRVLINGRDLNLRGEELKSYLRALDVERILKVEVITNPSARYDAEGSSGILNIVLKKRPKGFLGTLSSNTIYNGNWNYQLGGNASFSTDKIGTSFSLRYSDTKAFNDLRVNKSRIGESKAQSLFEDRSRSDLNTEFLVGKANINYFIDDKNTIGAFVKAFKQRREILNDGTSNFMVQDFPFKTELQADNYFDEINYSTGLNYTRVLDTLGTQLEVEYLHVGVDRDNNADQSMQFFEDEIFQDRFALTSLNEQDYTIHSVRADLNYIVNSKISLETGLKYSDVLNENNLVYNYNTNDQQYILIPIENNLYDYHERIYAFYLSGSFAFDRLALKLGNRIEYTDYTTVVNIEGKEERNRNDYLNFFPNLGITYTTDNGNSLSFSYGRRLERPNYADLNPSILYVTQYIYSQGNPLLLPEYSDNFELGLKVGKWITSVFANFKEQPIGDYLVQDEAQNTLLLVKENFTESTDLGVLFTTNFDLTKKADLRFYGIGRWQRNTFEENFEENWSANLSLRFNYQFDSKLSANWSVNYTSPFLYGLYRVNGQLVNNAGITWNQGPFTVGATVSDIFGGGRWDSQITTDGFTNYWLNRWPTSVINLSVRYQFGNGKSGSKGRYRGKTSSQESDRI